MFLLFAQFSALGFHAIACETQKVEFGPCGAHGGAAARGDVFMPEGQGLVGFPVISLRGWSWLQVQPLGSMSQGWIQPLPLRWLIYLCDSVSSFVQ